MSEKLTGLTESIVFSDSDLFYSVLDPGGSPLSRSVSALNLRRWIPMPMSGITGLKLSNNVGDANNDIDIAVGRACADAGDYNLILASALTKQLDAAWAVGTNQGGLDTGAKANSTWYHVWLIARVDTHVVDVLFSTSVSSPTMPADYTKKRRIGAILTDASGNILKFFQYGDRFLWFQPPALDVNATITTSRSDHALASVPPGLVVRAIVNMLSIHASATTVAYVSNPNLSDDAPATNASPLGQMRLISAPIPVQAELITDTSAQISARSSSSATTFRVSVLGWEDPRGKW